MKKIWLIAFLFLITLSLYGTDFGVGLSIKTNFLQLNIHSNFEKISWGAGLNLAGNQNSLVFKTGNLAFSGGISKLSTPRLSSSISPFTKANTQAYGIKAEFESSSSYSKPDSLFAEYDFTNKNQNQFLINGLYIPENQTMAFSSGYSWNIKKGTQAGNALSLNKTSWNLFLTAGIFPYEALKEDSWFLSQKYYGKGFQKAFSLESSRISQNQKSLVILNFYSTPLAAPVITIRNENVFKINNYTFSISEFLNYGEIEKGCETSQKAFSTSGTTLKEEAQLKLNLQKETRKKDSRTYKKGISLYWDFDLYNIHHDFNTSFGYAVSKKKTSNTVSSNLNFSFEPENGFFLNQFNLKYNLSMSMKSLSLSAGINCLFYPPENLFLNPSFSKWNSQQSFSLSLRSNGVLSFSTSLSSTLYEKDWIPSKINLEYAFSISYKRQWLSCSIGLKNHITCEF